MADAVLKDFALDEVAFVELLRKLISVSVRLATLNLEG